jgi:hypothetical protein
MLDNLVDSLSRRLPPPTSEMRYSFIQTAPWLALLSAALGLLIGGRGTLLLEIPTLISRGFLPSPLFLFAALSPIFALVAIPGLRDRQNWGWWLFATSVLIDLLLSLLRFDIFSLAFSALFLYLLIVTHEEYGRRWR